MDEIRVSSIEELISHLNALPNHYVYRGHADASWSLQSSLERILASHWPKEGTRKFEDYTLQKFKQKFHLFDRENARPKHKLGWLALMQHYGVPTRLLDFTESPYVALYFAIEGYAGQGEGDFAVYAIDYKGLMDVSIQIVRKKVPSFPSTQEELYASQEYSFDKVIDKQKYPIVLIAEPTLSNSRLHRQAGSFLLAGDSRRRIEDILASKDYSGTTIRKYIISHRFYKSIFALLRKMNLTSSSVYGDLSGLALAIKMEMLVYADRSTGHPVAQDALQTVQRSEKSHVAHRTRFKSEKKVP